MLGAGLVLRLFSGLTTIVLIGLLPPAVYGEFTTGIFWSLIISLVAGAGFSDLVIRSAIKTGGAAGRSMAFHAALGGALTGVLLATLLALTPPHLGLSAEGQTFFALIAAAAVLSAASTIAQSVLRAEGRMRLTAHLLILTALLTQGGLLALAWFAPFLVGLGLWYLCAFLALFILHVLVLGPQHLLRPADFSLGRLWQAMAQALPVSAAQLFMLLLPVLAASLTLARAGAEAAGAFNALLSLFFAAANIAVILDQAVFPRLLTGPRQQPRRSAIYLLLSLTLSLPAVAIFGLLGPALVRTIFGATAESMAVLAPLLAALIPLRFVGYWAASVLRAAGRPTPALLAYGLTAAALCLGTLVLPIGEGAANITAQIGLLLVAAEGGAVLFLTLLAQRLCAFNALRSEAYALGAALIASLAVSVLLPLWDLSPSLVLFAVVLSYMGLCAGTGLPGRLSAHLHRTE